MLDSLRSFFAAGDKPLQNAEQPTAFSSLSMLYTASDFGPYNPDDLIGRKGFGVYKKMMLDEQVKAAVHFKRDATTSRDFIFELDPEESGLSDEEVENRIYIAEQTIRHIRGSWMDVLNMVMSAMYNGFSATEMMFTTVDIRGKTWWGIDRCRLRPFDTIYFKTDDYGDLSKMVQKIAGREVDLDPRKFIHFVVNPDVDEWYGQSNLREAHRAWFNKDIITKFRNIWLERHAGGYTTIRPTGSKVITAGSSEYVALQDALHNMSAGTGLILPANLEMDTWTPSNQVAFKEAIDDCDASIARAVLIPNLLGMTPQQKVGARAQSETEFEAFLWTLEADARRLEEALNEQVFRLLGEVNWGDGWFPRFKFKPVSEAKKYDLLELWSNLVQKSAVKHTEADEAHVREMLDFPPLPKPEEGSATDTAPESALNGAQVSSMIEVLTKVKTGEITEGAARGILKTAFPLSQELIDDMLAGVEVEEPEPVPPQLVPPGQVPVPVPEPEDEEPAPEDETVIGVGMVSVSAFNRAVKRVDFAVIDKTSEQMVDDDTAAVADAMGAAVNELIPRVGEMYDNGSNEMAWTEGMRFEAADWIEGIRFDSKALTKIRNTVKSSLGDAWKLGEKHARAEIEKAKKTEFKASAERLDFIEAEFFDIKSFAIVGKLSGDALAIVKNEILNGAKFGKTFDAVELSIYTELVREGFITGAAVPASISASVAAALNNANLAEPHRLRTMVRTTTFEAINEARYAYFTDPELGGFVEALEYTAILDSRTTPLCQHLDGKTHPADSSVWNKYRPPNHFNCRSLLIPVTEFDDWTETDQPTMEPSKGFA